MTSQVLLAVWLLAASAYPAAADDAAPPPQAQLKVTVLDQSGAALITAAVTLVDPSGTPHLLQVDQRGEATFERLPPGQYQLKAEADAFQPYDAPLTIKKGTNQVTLKLPLASLSEQVVVTN